MESRPEMNIRILFRKFNDRSIRTKLILAFLVTAVLPLLLLALITDRTARLALTDAANQALFSVASQTADEIDRFVNDSLETISSEAQLNDFQDYLLLAADIRSSSDIHSKTEDLLFRLTEIHRQDQQAGSEYLLGYSLVDRSGTIILDTHFAKGQDNPFLGRSWSNRDYFLQPALTGLPFSSQIEISPEIGVPGLYFAKRIVNEQNQPIGVLLAHYNSSILQDLVAAQNDLAGDGSFGVLFDDNFIHLAHGSDPDVIFKTVMPLEDGEFRALKTAGRLPDLPAEDIFLQLPDLDARLRSSFNQPFFEAKDVATGDLINQVAVARLDTYPWLVTFFQPQEIFLSPAEKQTNLALLLTAAITVLTIAMALQSTRFIAGPILELTGSAKMLAAGDLGSRANVYAQDEIGALARTFNEMAAQVQETLSGLEEQVEERTRLLAASAKVGRAASSILNPDELISEVVNLIAVEFNYYFVALFLVDESGRWANLVQATGDIGATLKARRHRIEVGGRSMVGDAIRNQQARISQDVAGESMRYKNPLLPKTRSEIALPLMAGDRILGALNAQSIEPKGFDEREVQTLQNMADQVAIALENARLFYQAQSNLDEIRRLNEILMEAGWSAFTGSAPNAVRLQGNQTASLYDPDVPGVTRALREKKLVQLDDARGTSITIPLLLRGQVVGVVHARSDGQAWHSDTISILEAVAGQAALALENARLLQSSRRNAEFEQIVGDITTQLHGTLDLDTVLQTAATKMRDILNLDEIEIELVRPHVLETSDEE